jgi:hypothetical protein
MIGEQALKRTMERAHIIDPDATEFVVWLWDGMDGEWMEVTGPLSEADAATEWLLRTDNGSRNIVYGEIDYYAIYPTTVKLVFSEDGLGSQTGR